MSAGSTLSESRYATICHTVCSDAFGLMPIIAVLSIPSRMTLKSPASELAFWYVPVVKSGAPVSSLPVASRPWQRPHCWRNRREPIRTSTLVMKGFSVSWATGAAVPPVTTSAAMRTVCARPSSRLVRIVQPL